MDFWEWYEINCMKMNDSPALALTQNLKGPKKKIDEIIGYGSLTSENPKKFPKWRRE